MPAGNTYEAIATTTLGSATATVTLTSIPATYTDLRLVISNTNHSFVGTGRVYDTVLQFNNDTATNYSSTNVLGNGVTATSTISSNQSALQIHWSRASDDPGLMTFDIMNYSNTTTYKTTVYRTSTGNATAAAYVGLWRSTAAISEIDVTISATYTISAGTVISLYGIKAA
jgi:hypothetical protein